MDLKRPLSWSAISSFEYDPEQWYRKYVLGEKQLPTAEMLFGSAIGQRIATDPNFLPHLPRHKVFEMELRTTFNKIPLIGFIDSFEWPKTKKARAGLLEYKTGKRPWTQARADEHGQIDMYLLMLHLLTGCKPEEIDCQLVWLPTQQDGSFEITFVDEKKIHAFATKRSMVQILQFGTRIKKTYKAMQDYAKSHD